MTAQNRFFDAQWYLARNPDVSAGGYTTETAWQHYVAYGAIEAYESGGTVRAPNPWFDVHYYLSANPDLQKAGIGPALALEHFVNHGMYELRAPNAQVGANPMTLDKLLSYVEKNPDLASAFAIADPGLVTPAQLLQIIDHYYQHGYAENRPCDPTTKGCDNDEPSGGKTYTLTTDVDTITGTQFADIFRGQVNDTGSGADPTITTGDRIDGAAGRDSLIITGAGGVMQSGATFSNIEIVTVRTSSAVITNSASGELDSTAFGSSVQQLWQTGMDQAGDVRAAAGVTVGFADTLVNNKVTLAGTTGRIELSNVQGEAGLSVVGNDLTTLTISGNLRESDSPDPNYGDSYLFLDLGNQPGDSSDQPADGNTPELSNLNLNFSSEVALWFLGTNLANVTTINASGSSGDLVIPIFDPNCGCDDSDIDGLQLQSLRTGRGNDTVILESAYLQANDVAIDLGSGNDLLGLDITTGATATSITITLGNGRDLMTLGSLGGGNLVDVATTDDLLDSLITVADFSAGNDAIDLSDLFVGAQRSDQAQIDDAVDGAATLWEATNAAATVVKSGSDTYAVFNFQGSAYLFAHTSTDGDALPPIEQGDTLLRLSGTSADQLIEGVNILV
jgi:hypothetical protein